MTQCLRKRVVVVIGACLSGISSFSFCGSWFLIAVAHYRAEAKQGTGLGFGSRSRDAVPYGVVAEAVARTVETRGML